MAAAPAVSSLETELASLDKLIGGDAPAMPTSPTAAVPQQPQFAQQPMTPEVQQVQYWAANPEVAKSAVDSARNWVVMNNALAKGDVQGFLGMLEPSVQQAITQHLWQQNRDTLIQQYTDEQNGIRTDPRMEMLQRQVEALTAHLQGQQQQTVAQQQQAEQQRAQAALANNFANYSDSLFSAVGLKDSPHRLYLENAVKGKVFSDPKMAANIRAGRFGDYGRTFRELYPTFRALLSGATTPPPQAAQPASAQLMTAAAGSTSGSLPPANPNEGIVDGQMTSKWWANQKDRLKKMIG